MTDFVLGKSTKLRTIAIRVKDRDKAIAFYRDVLGFDLKREENELAILGFKGAEGEVIWLEESPRANDHFGEIKKMQRIRLTVASLEELAAICKKAKEQSATFEESFYEGTQETDLPKTLEALIEAAPSEVVLLSSKARFNQIHLNVSDVAKERDFLEELLGLTTKEADGFLHLNEDDFQVGLIEGQGGTIDLPTHEVLGLDFLKIAIDKEDLLTLEAHLTDSKQEFFIDKKKNLLTTYDTIGIEWWFVANK